METNEYLDELPKSAEEFIQATLAYSQAGGHLRDFISEVYDLDIPSEVVDQWVSTNITWILPLCSGRSEISTRSSSALFRICNIHYYAWPYDEFYPEIMKLPINEF